MKETTIEIPVLARFEGEGALNLVIKNNEIAQLQLRIYEPPRLFEKFLESRSYTELLDIVSRICGICPVAYQMTAAQAIENIFKIKPSPWVRQMRKLFYCGEWIESHSLHIHMLALPDFLGYPNALDMAKEYPEEIKRGMRLQSLGNALVKFLGARAVHPVGACISGFYHAPTQNDAELLLKQLKNGLNDAEALLQWTVSLSLPENNYKSTYVALRHTDEYPILEGRIISSEALNISIEEFEQYFYEKQVPYSNASHCDLQGKPYLVGPLARVNLNFDQLPSDIHRVLYKIRNIFPSDNMFHSIIARAVEIYYGLLASIEILENYIYPDTDNIKSLEQITPISGVGYGCTEAPRGILWHRYEIDTAGLIQNARIVPPTCQYQYRIEEDLRYSLINYGLNHSDEELRKYSEMIIRNYDPCISCSTHFLQLTIKRE